MLGKLFGVVVFMVFVPFVYACEEQLAIDRFLTCVKSEPNRDFNGFCGAVVTIDYSMNELINCFSGNNEVLDGGAGEVVIFNCQNKERISVNLKNGINGCEVSSIDEVVTIENLRGS